MFALSNEVTRELVQSNRTDAITVEMITDRLWERFKEEAILSGDRWTKERAEEKARARYKQLTEGSYSFTSRADNTTLQPVEKPFFHLDLVDSKKGTAALELVLGDFFQSVSAGGVPRQVVRITMGSGKTHQTVKKIKDYLAQNSGKLVEVYVLRHDLADEFARELAECEAINAKVVHVYPRTGGTIDLSTGQTAYEPHCDRAAYVRELEVKNHSVFVNACLSKEGDRCIHFDTCRYLQQFRPLDDNPSGNVVRIYQHQNLGLPRNEFEENNQPDLVIIDENFLFSVIDTRARVNPEAIRQYIRTERLPNLGGFIVDSLRDGENLLDILRKLGVTAGELSSIDLSAIQPEVSFEREIDTARTLSSAREYRDLRSVLRILGEELGNGERDQVERLVFDRQRNEIVICQLKINRIPDDAPILILDATADQALLEKLIGPLEFERIDIEQGAFVTQVYNRTGSNNWWNDDPNDRKVDKLVQVMNEWVNYGRKPYCVSHKALADNLRQSDNLNNNVMVNHFGNLRGTNKAKDQSVVFITGRNEPPVTAADYAARAIFWDDAVALQHDDLTKPLHLELRGYTQSEVKPGPVPGVMVRAFSDPRIEAVHNQQRETETVQAIARLRLVHTEYRKKVFLLGNLPVEIPVDRLVTFDDLMPDRLENEFIERGNLPLTALGIVKMRPDITTSVDAAGKILKRSNVINPDTLFRSHPELARSFLTVATFKAGDARKREHKHLFIPPDSNFNRDTAIWIPLSSEYIKAILESGWGEICDLKLDDLYKGISELNEDEKDSEPS